MRRKVARVRQSHARWRLRRGTTFSFVLDQDARVGLAFMRKVGRRKVAIGTLPVTGHSGTNKVRFRGRLSRSKTLRPGRYTVAITATNAGGRSAARSLRFTVVGR